MGHRDPYAIQNGAPRPQLSNISGFLLSKPTGHRATYWVLLLIATITNGDFTDQQSGADT